MTKSIPSIPNIVNNQSSIYKPYYNQTITTQKNNQNTYLIQSNSQPTQISNERKTIHMDTYIKYTPKKYEPIKKYDPSIKYEAIKNEILTKYEPLNKYEPINKYEPFIKYEPLKKYEPLLKYEPIKKYESTQQYELLKNYELPKKYETLNKYEPTKKYEIKNVMQSKSSQIQSKPQQINNKWINNFITNNNLDQQRKCDYSKSINENTNIKISSSGINTDVRNSNPQIYNSKTSSDYNKNTPKLKYYAKCPNCGFQLNDEETVNNYNRTLVSSNVFSNNSMFGNIRGNYGTYDKKTYLRKNDKKGKAPNIQNIDKNNYNGHSVYNQNNSEYSFRYLQKVKDRDKYLIPNNNVNYYESKFNFDKKINF